jgi:thiol-disulfide isomerase/thioredoxin
MLALLGLLILTCAAGLVLYGVRRYIGIAYEGFTDGGQLDTAFEDDGVARFVLYYANWCGACKHIAPSFAAVENHFAEQKTVDGIPVSILKIEESDPRSKLVEIEGFPTFYVHYKGKRHVFPYTGPLSPADVEAFIRKLH